MEKDICDFTGKISYKSENSAKIAKNKINNYKEFNVIIYKCPSCYKYHFTKK